MNAGRMISDNRRYEKARQYAILNSGYKFIKVILKDISKKNVTGIYVLDAISSYSHKEKREVFSFIEKGGHANFVESDELGGGYVDWFLDDAGGHNRRFLASHYYGDYFQIADDKIDKEIKNLADEMKSEMVGTPSAILKLADKMGKIQQKLKVCVSEDEAVKLRKELNEVIAEEISIKEGGPVKNDFDEPKNSASEPVKKRRGRKKKVVTVEHE